MKPNILSIMSDDHAAHAMSCYGSKVNETPSYGFDKDRIRSILKIDLNPAVRVTLI